MKHQQNKELIVLLNKKKVELSDLENLGYKVPEHEIDLNIITEE